MNSGGFVRDGQEFAEGVGAFTPVARDLGLARLQSVGGQGLRGREQVLGFRSDLRLELAHLFGSNGAGWVVQSALNVVQQNASASIQFFQRGTVLRLARILTFFEEQFGVAQNVVDGSAQLVPEVLERIAGNSFSHQIMLPADGASFLTIEAAPPAWSRNL